MNNWLIRGETLGETEKRAALIGDSLSATLFQDPLQQTFKTLNNEFSITGVCLDPLNNGMVAYLPYEQLSAITAHSGYNVLLLQIDSEDYTDLLIIRSQIEKEISGKNLVILELDGTLKREEAFLSHLWTLMLSLTGQQKDLVIMRALGAGPKAITRVIFAETFILVMAGGAIGLFSGTMVALWFFIPEAVVSKTAAMAIIGLLSGLIGILLLSSLYPARKITKMPIVEA